MGAPALHPDLETVAARLPRFDYAEPLAVRRGMSRNIALAESAGFWRRHDPRVTWTDMLVPGTTIPVRVYVPEPAGEVSAVVVYFHGGGFVVGDLDMEHPRCLEMSARVGASVVSVDYRLAPENPFPAGLEDCAAAVEWVMSGGAFRNLEPQRVALAGCSAGGCLAAAVALLRRDLGQVQPAMQLLLYPVLDDRMVSGSMLDGRSTPGWDRQNTVHMWRHYVGGVVPDGAGAAYAAPARAGSVAKVAPAYIATAELDPLRDEALAYALRLLAADVPAEIHQFRGAFHGFDTLADAPICRRAREEHYAVLRDALGTAATAGC